MLGKLLKYDLKKTFKFLIIFYTLAILFAGLARLFFGLEQNLMNQILAQIAFGTMIAMIANILINNIIRMFVYLRSNLYGDESYLTHTLPVERKTLFQAKFILAAATLFTSIVVVVLTLMVCLYSKDNFETLKIIISPETRIADAEVLKIVGAGALTIFLEIFAMVMAGMNGIIFGHRKLTKRVGWSFLIGLGIYSATQILAIGGLALIGLVVPEIGEILFKQNQNLSLETIKIVVIYAGIIYSAIIAGLYFIGKKHFEKIDIE